MVLSGGEEVGCWGCLIFLLVVVNDWIVFGVCMGIVEVIIFIDCVVIGLGVVFDGGIIDWIWVGWVLIVCIVVLIGINK